MKVANRLGIYALALAIPAAAYAATGSYTATAQGPNVYAAGAENSSFFSPPSSVPTAAKLSTISYSTGRYNNGASSQQVSLCYAPQYTTNYTCTDISATPTGSSSAFSGMGAKGKIKITFVITGGTYPATAGFQNSITANYTY